MTTPNPIVELLAALENDPHLEETLRQRLLTRELLDLPNKVAELADMIARMAETLDRRLTAVEERVDALETQQAATNERLDHMDERFDRITADQWVMRGQLNNLNGSDYERKVVRRASRLVRRHLGVRNATVLMAINRPAGDTIAGLLDNGVDRGASPKMMLMNSTGLTSSCRAVHRMGKTPMSSEKSPSPSTTATLTGPVPEPASCERPAARPSTPPCSELPSPTTTGNGPGAVMSPLSY